MTICNAPVVTVAARLRFLVKFLKIGDLGKQRHPAGS
jgi:hypothetical protein